MIHLDTKQISKVDMKTFAEKVDENNKIHVSVTAEELHVFSDLALDKVTLTSMLLYHQVVQM